MDKLHKTFALSGDELIVRHGFDNERIPLDALPIDQSPALGGNINPDTGFPYTDIQLVMRANTLAERNNLMDNLQSNKPDYLDDTVTNEQAAEDLLPKDAQMPSEVAEHYEAQLQSKIEEHNKAVDVKERQEILDQYMELNKKDVESKSE